MSGYFLRKLALFSIVFYVLGTHCGCYASDSHKKLRKALFGHHNGRHDNYDRAVRPVIYANTTTVVEMQFFVAQVLDVDERLETFKINAWLTMRWFDEYLMWDPYDYQGLENFKIAKDELWMPDLWLYNNAGSRYEDYTANSQCSVFYTGRVVWQSPAIIKTHCTMDVTNFPFDFQTCSVVFGPWQHTTDEILLNGSGSAELYLRSSGEWEIISFNVSNRIQEYRIYADDPLEAYSYVEYSVALRRVPTYFVFYLIMPCSLISATTLLSFFLPAESGEKISLGITVLLSLTVFLLLVAELLPPSGAVPIVAIYYATTMVMVSLSLSFSVVVLNLHHRGADTRPVPKWMKRIMLGKVSRILLLRRVSFKADEKGYNPVPKMKYRPPGKKQTVFTSMEMNDIYDHEPVDTNDSSSGTEADRANNRSMLLTHRPQSHNSYHSTRELSILKKILEEFQLFRSIFAEKEKDEAFQSEWKQVALVIDRIFMLIYIIGMFATIFIIIGHVNYT
ncbi:neuronal acetylcholine receptor subunit alpha-9-like [Amphiura filiformis]|uniref:neuronal acetylcholine receptor subunit alpha-9-like n=1 Tax=Amphiura filiformis TaxID=82378 RepID=UPI003B219FF7